jgi:hypothetical protein
LLGQNTKKNNLEAERFILTYSEISAHVHSGLLILGGGMIGLHGREHALW